MTWNKGLYGQKTLNFKNGQPNYCEVHGLHYDWVYHSNRHSCTCRLCRNERSTEYQSNPKNKLKRVLQDAKQHAKKYNRVFDITIEDLNELMQIQESKCALSGIVFDEKGLNAPSLDRMNSEQGYIKGNIQFVTVAINRMKSNFDQTYFIEVCKKIAYLTVKTFNN